MLISGAHELGQLIRDQRKRLGVTQQVLAQRVGVSRHWVMALERGNAGAEVGLVLKALAAVGLRFDARGSGAAEADAGAVALRAAVDEAVDRTRVGEPPRRLRLSRRREP
jgi:HTH-type transcriptional regulator/antitoxin HipB